jgi:hypothetical protein
VKAGRRTSNIWSVIKVIAIAANSGYVTRYGYNC